MPRCYELLATSSSTVTYEVAGTRIQRRGLVNLLHDRELPHRRVSRNEPGIWFAQLEVAGHRVTRRIAVVR